MADRAGYNDFTERVKRGGGKRCVMQALDDARKKRDEGYLTRLCEGTYHKNSDMQHRWTEYYKNGKWYVYDSNTGIFDWEKDKLKNRYKEKEYNPHTYDFV